MNLCNLARRKCKNPPDDDIQKSKLVGVGIIQRNIVLYVVRICEVAG